jgi:hypothetical protein
MLLRSSPSAFAALLAGLVAITTTASAQPIGTFTWQLQPFCNLLKLNVTQSGSVYTLDGYDDQCGAARRAPAVGLATLNPDGTVGIGLTIVTTPGGTAVHVDGAIGISTLGGTWDDSLGNSGSFVFTPGAGVGGSPRPLSASGVNLGYQVVSSSQVIQTGAFDLTASCPTGKRAIAGGHGFSNVAFVTSFELIDSSPTTGGAGWRIRGNTANSSVNFLAVRAICVVVQ